MCGIAGLFTFDSNAPPVDAGALDRLRDAMTARGPDGFGSWMHPGGHLGLAHRRLAIIDLNPSGAQPMASADGKLVISFNGEIYNYRELRDELTSKGAVFRSTSDTEVLLHLYRQEGPAMLKRLKGMFAFALWDEAKQGLLLARDAFGIKPLYIARGKGRIALASSVKALLALPWIDRRPEPAGHAGFFLWGHVPEPYTLYRDIAPLPAGCLMWIGKDGAERLGRWFDPAREMIEARSIDVPLAEALSETVRRHLVADVPVGLFLSAGRDSATAAALACEACDAAKIDAITLGFAELAGSPADEVPLARLLARHLGVRHSVRHVTDEDFHAWRGQILLDMDQPTIDGVNTWLVAKVARELGLKVALSGVGGDEMFAGYDTFTQVPALAQRLSFARNMPGLGRALRQALAPWIGALASPKAAGLLEYGGTLAGAYLLKRGLFMPWDLPGLIGDGMAQDGLEKLAVLARLEDGLRGLKQDRDKMAALEIGNYLKNQLLRDTDWAGMAHGLEIRTPLVDVALFENLLPFRASKADLAATPKRALPGEILNRAKSGFSVPVVRWMGETSYRGWAKRVYGAFG
ncbi:MAG: asparagine synthase (glutamine-hydrolyzing) [Rhodospirillales bacterium]|nr:MAG: asparagine synthase (glutamine-hydrolyzing) [Rhodospirillales bacterium]